MMRHVTFPKQLITHSNESCMGTMISISYLSYNRLKRLCCSCLKSDLMFERDILILKAARDMSVALYQSRNHKCKVGLPTELSTMQLLIKQVVVQCGYRHCNILEELDFYSFQCQQAVKWEKFSYTINASFWKIVSGISQCGMSILNPIYTESVLILTRAQLK